MFKHKTAYKSKNITRSLITGGRSYFKVGGGTRRATKTTRGVVHPFRTPEIFEFFSTLKWSVIVFYVAQNLNFGYNNCQQQAVQVIR